MTDLTAREVRSILAAHGVTDNAGGVLDELVTDLARAVEDARSLIRDLADEQEASVRHEYRGRTFPAAQAMFDADMDAVTRARAFLSPLPDAHERDGGSND